MNEKHTIQLHLESTIQFTKICDLFYLKVFIIFELLYLQKKKQISTHKHCNSNPS